VARERKTTRARVKIWDAATGHELGTIYDESSWGVTALAFSPDGKTLASGNGMLLFWTVPEHLVATMVR